jgi:hypothetical protein
MQFLIKWLQLKGESDEWLNFKIRERRLERGDNRVEIVETKWLRRFYLYSLLSTL